MYHVTYSLTDGSVPMYCQEKGFGFVDLLHTEGKTDAARALRAGGWNLRRSRMTGLADSVCASHQGVFVTSPRNVAVFKADVPDFGTYRVRVELDAGDAVQNMSLFAGRRNLIWRGICVPAGANFSREFFVNVTPYIPALTATPDSESAVYISVTGENAGLSRIYIERADVPVLYIAGDSTVTDQNAPAPYYPYGCGNGWAQDLAQYFPSAAICNFAHSGMTTNCFRDDGHWDILWQYLRPGDMVLIQFGHNDQKRRNLAAFGGYINNLRWYVKKIRERNAFPVICSPISRIPETDPDTKKPYSLLALHALAAGQAAQELQVPFIDLHDRTFRLWCRLGDAVHDYFNDGTHTNEYGGCRIAGIVAEEIRRQNIQPAAKLLGADTPEVFSPDADTKELPEEPAGPGMFDIDLPYVDISGCSQRAGIEKAFRGGLLDPCVMHLHPGDTLPRAQFLMVLFKALRLSGVRPYEGHFTDLGRYEWDSSYVQACLNEDLIDPETVTADLFRPDAPLTCAEFASFAERGMVNVQLRAGVSLDAAFARALSDGVLPPGVQPDAPVTRGDVYAGLARVMELLGTSGQALPRDAEIHPVS
ncbi:MAG: GDSL-type esterase/lipase family protein [Lachnospira sp.]|nr:GDSL-type esterase/lipase family protein [Lachnospira sp.]